MKSIHVLHIMLFICLGICPLTLFALDQPKGFNKANLARVLKGESIKSFSQSGNVYNYTWKFYIEETTLEDYLALVVDGKGLTTILKNAKSDIKNVVSEEVDGDEASELNEMIEKDDRVIARKEDKDQTYQYGLDISINYYIKMVEVPLEGVQKIWPDLDENDETHIVRIVKSEWYKNEFDYAKLKTRLIPHESGLLVEQTVELSLKTTGLLALTIRSDFERIFFAYFLSVKKELSQ